MAIVFEALEPGWVLAGAAPTYRIRFINDVTGVPTAVDSVDSLEVINPSTGAVLRSYTPPDIITPQIGYYQVSDLTIDDASLLALRWSWTIGVDSFKAVTSFEVINDPRGLVESQIMNEIRHRLGSGWLEVELPLGTLRLCLDDAYRWYTMAYQDLVRHELVLIPGEQKYQMPADCFFVVDVIFPDKVIYAPAPFVGQMLYGLTGIGAQITNGGLISGQTSDGFYSSVVQAVQTAEMGRRIFGREPSWEWLKREKRLYLYPRITTGGTAFVDYASSQVDTENMDPSERWFITNYALATAKEALGRIRGKYQGYPGADGERSLDSSELLGEAQNEKQQLTERLRKWAPQGWIVTG
jgi:hypothetical protein